MRNMYNVIGMIILVVSAALGIVFTVAMDASQLVPVHRLC